MDLAKYKKLYVDSEMKLYFLPVLDYNAAFAAQFLCKEDMQVCYTFLKVIFQAIEKGTLKEYVIMNDFLSQGNRAFFWIVTFFKELEKLLQVEEVYPIPFYDCSKDGEISFPPPYSFKKGKEGFRIEPVKLKLKSGDVVNMYRVVYIKNCYEVMDFIDGYPSWYILSDTTIFEEYNIKTNKRIRIDCNRGEFLYFIAGASDNWQQIVDVPLEIDYVIAALLFRN